MTSLETVQEKAQRLVDEHRVVIRSMDIARVCGDHDVYTVTASPHGISCTCLGWRPTRVCSHVYAAQIQWSEWIQEAAAS